MSRKKKQYLMLHMHQVRDFIVDRHSFYNNYFRNQTPKTYQYKGVQKAFQVGSAVDIALKQYYTNKNNNKDVEKDLFNNNYFTTLPSKLDQTIVLALINGYITKYNLERFHSFEFPSYKIKIRSGNFIILCRPDLMAKNYFENKDYVIEFKTSYDDNSAETLDFQTMTYAWAKYRWDYKIPAGVIKRTIFKPRIKQRKNETESEFQKRIIYDITDHPEKYFKSNYRPINKNMIINFENYLKNILDELYIAIKSQSKFKFYKRVDDYWGI